MSNIVESTVRKENHDAQAEDRAPGSYESGTEPRSLQSSESGGSEDEDRPELEAFGSGMNLGGGVIPDTTVERKAPSKGQRAKANMKLCGTGALAGAGMFAESYFLFAIGNIKGLWKKAYPSCFPKPNQTYTEPCSAELVSALEYIEVLGVIVGMITFGFFADKLGRRWGSCSTATIMFLFGTLTAVAYAGKDNLTGLFTVFAVALFLFSYGVGGEYPLASTSAAERAEKAKRERDLKQPGVETHIRGKSVVFVFAMQGWGNWVNTLFIMFILLGLGCTGNECTTFDYELTWRLQYAIGALFLAVIMVYRFKFLKESEMWKEKKEKRAKLASTERTPPGTVRQLAVKYYWHRMLGTGVGWFVWDVVFYGNKLFQSSIISAIIGPQATVYQTLQYTLINATVALAGYYLAALCIDKPWMGRRRMQLLGFLMTFVLFLICAACYPWLSRADTSGPSVFFFLYSMSTFFGQFGPNCTTWLLPSEVFPTEIRALSHGISAAMGKAGALLATVLFTYGNHGAAMDAQSIFYVCAACGLVGFAITFVFVPEVTTLNLSSADERWDLIVKHRVCVYHGPALNPQYLSFYERSSGLSCACDVCRGRISVSAAEAGSSIPHQLVQS